MFPEPSPGASHDREPIEILAAEFVERHRNGDSPSIDDFVREHPELADDIRDLFPTIARLENLKVTKERSSDGRAMAGLPRSLPLGGFRILREVGRGGMGVVYEAEDKDLKRRVAVKVLGANIAGSRAQLQRFQHEAAAAARLHHPHIVPVFGTGEEHGVQYYVMQYIDGLPLSDVIENLRRAARPSANGAADAPDETVRAVSLPARWRNWRAIAQICIDLAEALSYAHSQGVLHRDVKPANVLVDRNDCVWIGDFGLAKQESHPGVTRTGDLVGTVRYMAPEQFQGIADARSDIYSLGLTLYELLTLQPAFAESRHGPLIRQKATAPVSFPRLLDPGIPRDLQTITLKACALEPAHRYQSAAEFAQDLRRFAEDRPIRARRTSPVERLWRWSRRNPLVASLSGVALVLLAAVAVVFFIGNRQTSLALKSAVDAKNVADAERRRAEKNLQLAVQALDEIVTNVSERGIPQTLQMGVDGDEARLEHVMVTAADAALLQSMLHFYDEFASDDRAGLNAQTARALDRIGAIQQRLGKPAEAETALWQAIEVYQQLIQGSPDDRQLAIDLATTWNHLGTVRSQGGNFPDAVAAHSAALEVLRASPAANTSRGKFQIVETLILLASVGSRTGGGEVPLRDLPSPERDRRPNPASRTEDPGRVPQAPRADLRPQWGHPPPFQAVDRDEVAHQAIALLKELLDHDPANPAFQFALARSHRLQIRVGPSGRQHRSPADARQAADEAIQIFRQLVSRFPDSAVYTYELASTLIRTAQRIPGVALEEREKWVGEALQLATQLVSAHPQVPEYRALLAATERRLGEFAHLRGEEEECNRRYQHALKLHEELSQRFLSVSLYQIAYAQTLSEWARVQRARGQPEEGRVFLETAIGVAERSAPLWGGDPMFRHYLANLHLQLQDFEEPGSDR
jgi:serine/threonine protein kinase/tetratricopeptide (TPR) repeat protein